MRTLLAVLAWIVMVGGVLGPIISTLSAIFLLRQRGLLVAGYAGPMLSVAITGVFQITEALAIGLGLLFLLDLDKRARQGAGALEPR